MGVYSSYISGSSDTDLSGSVEITGSLTVTGSSTVSGSSEITGSLTIYGDTAVTGSLTVSGSSTFTVYGPSIFNEDGSDHDYRIESRDNANMFFVDAANNRVGIGTSAPGDTLGIDGDIHFQPTAISTSHITTAGSLDIRADNNIKIGTDGADSVRIGRVNTTAVKVHLRSGNDADLVLSNSKVGIGVEDPDTKLEVFNGGTQLKLSYNASDHATFAVDDDGDLTIDPSGDTVVITGNLTVNGTTTTVNTTNTVASDSLIELNNGATSNSNDCGIVIERGSTGDNAIIAWDESADGFVVGTTTATGASTGNLTISAAPFEASTITGTTITTSGAIELGHASDTTIARASSGQITVEGTAVILAGAVTGITSLLATDIKIGEDDQTKIDFETADEIHFYAANAEQVYVADGVFGPQTDSDVDLGTTGVRWKDAFVDTITTTSTITSGGAITSNAGIVVDNITIDGTEIDLSSGDLTLDVAGDIILNADGGEVSVIDDSATIAVISNQSGQGELRLHEAANYVGFKAPALSADQIWTLPAADGSNGQQLTTNGSGVLSWAAAGSGGGGATAADDIGAGDGAVNITTSSGDITIDAAANDSDIILKGTDGGNDTTFLTIDGSDAGRAIFNNDVRVGVDCEVLGDLIVGAGADEFSISESSDDITISTLVSNKDMIFKVNDGGSATEVFRLDGDVSALLVASGKELRFADSGEKISGDGTDLTIASGAKINLNATSDIHIPNDVGIVFGGASEKIEGDGTDLTISANNLTIDCAADLILDAGGNDFKFKAGGTEILNITNSSSDVIIKPIVDAKDLIFQQRDGTEVARIEDNGTFNVVSDKLAINGTAITATAAEVNLIDGGTSRGTTAVADGDGFLHNDGGTMRMTNVSKLADLFAGTGIDASSSVLSVAAAQTGITSILATDVKIGEDDQTKIDFEDADKINFYANNAKEMVLVENALTPGTNDGTALGTTALGWSDLHIATGGVINWANGEMTITETANDLAVAGGTLTVDGGINVDGILIDANQIFSANLKVGRDAHNIIDFSTDNEIVFQVNNSNEVKLVENILSPNANDGCALGSTSLGWSDLFLADGSTIKFGNDQDITLTHVADTGLTLESETASTPVFEIKNTNNGGTAGILKFNNTEGGNDGADGDDLGSIQFWGNDDGTPSAQQYAGILAEISDASSGAEGGKLSLQVAEHDGTVTTGLLLQDGNADGEIDVTIGAGADSLTTISGDLDIPNGGFALGSDASGDMYYRNSSGVLTRIPVGSDNHVLTLDGAVPGWEAASGGGSFSQFYLEDDDGTEVTIDNNKEIKIIGSGVTTNWTDTSHGSDGDPYDLTITVDAAQTGITSLLATDIKIGEDDQTKIDFETPDEIHFYAANAEQVYVADGIFGPQTDSDVDLGSNSVRWKDAYVDSVTSTGAIVGSTGTFSGVLKTDDTTNATSTTDGSLQTDGGLSVALDAVIGDDLLLLSDSANLSFGADSDVKLIHSADSGLIMTTPGDGGTGPKAILTLHYDSASPADNDITGMIQFAGDDSGGNQTAYAQISGTSKDVTNGTEDGAIAFDVMINGTAQKLLDINDTAASTITVKDGAYDFDIASHDGSNGLKLGGTLVTATAAELNVITGLNRGHIIVGNASNQPASLAQGSNGQVLTMDSNGDAVWAAASGGSDPSSADGDSLGTANAEWSDLYLADGAVIYFGNDQEITLTHVADTGLVLKHAASADNKFPTLTLQAGDNDIALNDVLGQIDFQAPDEGAGTDAVTVAASIAAISEGDFSSSNNATRLSFFTGLSGAATEKMALSSKGYLGIGTDAPFTALSVINDYHNTTFEVAMADGDAGGDILKYSPGADDSLTSGQIYFLHTDGTWDLADADAVASGASQLLGVGLGNARNNGVLLDGYVRIPATEILNTPGSGAVDGLPLYVSTTAGHFDFTAPSGTDDYVRIVGYAIDDDSGAVLVRFKPSSDWVVVA